MNNENWYIADSEKAAKELLEMFWKFHDFRIAQIQYDAKDERIDLLLEYDTDNLFVMLRFEHDIAMNFIPTDSPDNDWLSDSEIRIVEYDKIMWIAGYIGEDRNPLQENIDVLWIMGRRLMFAVVNADGDTIPIPDDILHQRLKTLNNYGKYEISERHFNPTKIVKL